MVELAIVKARRLTPKLTDITAMVEMVMTYEVSARKETFLALGVFFLLTGAL